MGRCALCERDQNMTLASIQSAGPIAGLTGVVSVARRPGDGNECARQGWCDPAGVSPLSVGLLAGALRKLRAGLERVGPPPLDPKETSDRRPIRSPRRRERAASVARRCQALWRS
jgi:hypothetical protein